MAGTLVASYTNPTSGTGTSNGLYFLVANSSTTWYQNAATATAVFTPAVGDVLVVKVATGQPVTTVTSIGNGYTGGATKGVVDNWDLAVNSTKASGVAPIWIYVATVVTAGAFNITVGGTTTSASNQVAGAIIEQWRGIFAPVGGWNAAGWPTTPDTASPFVPNNVSGTGLTGVAAGSVVSWAGADWNGKVTPTNYSSSPATYQNSAVATKQALNTTTGGLGLYAAYQTQATAGTAPISFSKSTQTGLSVTFAAVELPTVPPPVTIDTGQFLPFF